MSVAVRTLSHEAGAHQTSFTAAQNRAVLIAGLTCASFSLLVTIVTLRWFVLMKRTFRHQLVLFLICSDTFKAVWYFLFPVVVFSHGPVTSSSGFCQASGFFLALGVELSDFAILGIALHSIIYVFKPPTRSGESGGLYRWRNWIYPVWLGFPLLLASLAFVNKQDAYMTAGTFCYLPRRPFWYRLALAWIPRYLILCLIFAMYAAVYIHVILKFRSFSNLDHSSNGVSTGSHSRESSAVEPEVASDKNALPRELDNRFAFTRAGLSRAGSYRNETDVRPSNPWDEVSFITAKPLRNAGPWQPGIQASDFAHAGCEQNSSTGPRSPHSRQIPLPIEPRATSSRTVSACPTTGSSYTGDTITAAMQDPSPRQQSQHTREQANPAQPKPKDPLKRTRSAIQRQLGHLFIYPAVYVLMWIFPFAAHCLMYNGYYVRNPVYWLAVLQTCMLALQAAADCIVVSWREKPWRRIPEDSKFAMNNIRNPFSLGKVSAKTRSYAPSVSLAPDEHPGSLENGHGGITSGTLNRATSTHWWEAEGRKRKDSVWLGVDTDDVSGAILERSETLSQPPAPTVVEGDEEEYEMAHGNQSLYHSDERRGWTEHASPDDPGWQITRYPRRA